MGADGPDGPPYRPGDCAHCLSGTAVSPELPELRGRLGTVRRAMAIPGNPLDPAPCGQIVLVLRDGRHGRIP